MKQPAGGFGAPRAGQRADVHHVPAPPVPTGSRFFTLFGYFALAVLGTIFVGGIFLSRRYLTGATTNEAKNTVGQIAKDVEYAYREQGFLCPSSAPVPAAVTHGRKYQSAAKDWSDDPGWRCLRFELTAPQYYQYRYERSGDTFTVTAIGDLDADGVVATFVAHGRVDPGRRELIVDPSIDESNPEE